MKLAAALVLALLVAPSVFAQSRNAAYGEIFGNGLVYSLNYERRFTDTLAGRVGFAFVGSEDSDGDDDWAVAGPVMVNWINRPQSNHHLEAGIGLLLIAGEGSDIGSNVDEDFSGAAGTATLGYRFQRPTGGFVFRAGLTPIFDFEAVAPWFGVSFGYAW